MKEIKVLCFIDEQGPSQLQNSIIEEMRKDLKNIDFKIINSKEDGESVKKYNIKEYPSIIIEDGKNQMKFSGLTQQIFLERAIDKLLK
ncbi:MAG: thioredoxin domain-containing protein [Candidatus Aenigmatarchaeota archaeon]|nr:hypothetical protein [Candidatus Aenigmarchaeota archaeon]